jgi:Raf kinase inhibitor-like YbhB/YbcL family protein
MLMKLTSEDFHDGATIPPRFTCEGENVSPALAWEEAPADTKSFALVVEDPDAPRGVFRHWVCYDIAPERTALPEGAGSPGAAGDMRQGLNDFGKFGYNGPCPQRGHGIHHYRFRLLALGCDRLPIHPRPTSREVDAEVRKHILAEARIVGLYQR